MNSKSKEFFEMNNEELNNKVLELKIDLFNLRFKHATNQLSNANILNDTKKDIARVKTILRERELGISEEPLKAAKKKIKKSGK